VPSRPLAHGALMLIRALAVLMILSACAMAKPPVASIVPDDKPGEAQPPMAPPEQKCTNRPCVFVGAILDRITTKTADDADAFFKLVRSEKPDAVVIIIVSRGGMMDAGERIFNTFATSPVPVHCYAGGIAASAAFVILQGCSDRVSDVDTHLMIHEAYYKIPAGTPQDITIGHKKLLDLASSLDESNKSMCNMIGPRMQMKPEDLCAKIALGDWYMTPMEALASHAIDSIDLNSDPDGYVKSVKAELAKKK
jgi:ATP-dependent protease ClpP protease subunit